jgi:outer membrane protein TolC/ABC-type uncharacterized transport system substrate-binding protein
MGLLLMGAIGACMLLAGVAGAQMTAVRIGVVMDGPGEHETGKLAIFEREVAHLLAGEFAVSFPADKRLTGDWTRAGAEAALRRLLSDDEVDLVLTIGFLASCLATREMDLPKPVVAPFVVGALIGELPQGQGGSGVRNLVYLAIPDEIRRDLERFGEIVPFGKLAIIYHAPLAEAFLDAAQRVKQMLRSELGLEIIAVQGLASADAVLAEIPDDADAVYLSGLPAMGASEIGRVAEGLIERKLPSFSMAGRVHVEEGIMAGVLSAGIIDQRARRTAIIIQRILLGEAPASIPVAIATKRRLSINMATARAIGVSPSWAILTEADLVQEVGREPLRRWTLGDAMREAVRVNVDLAAQRYSALAGQQEISAARAKLLPQVDLGLTGILIDEDRASASLGQVAERTLSGSAGMTQLLFAEAAWANVSVQKHLQRGREEELQALRLDISQNAAVAYLDVLSALALEQIEKENLKLTRENLELARVRQSIGVAGPAEVYRWEAKIAQSRKEVITANARRNLSEMQLNRIMHRPIEEPFEIDETGLDDADLALRYAQPFVYVDNRQNFRLLRRFMTGEALAESPEIRQLDAAIAAQERLMTSHARRYYTPTLALQAQVENLIEEDGAGTGASALAPLLPPLPEADDVDWQIALSLSLPLFTGGERHAALSKARIELRQLRHRREALAERIEQRVRAALHTSGASFASIGLTREAAAAASRTLEIVTDAYARGGVSVLELLDAQNAALATEQAAAIAVYQFLADYARVQRATGRFDVFASDEVKRGRIERLERYIRDHGGALRDR